MRTITPQTDRKKGKRENMKLQLISGLVLALTLVMTSSVYAQQNAGVLLQSGLYKEDVNGDLEAAIGIYERVLKDFPEDRAHAAKALLHIGLCYEKLGKQEAQKAYHRLINEFADQSESVRIARRQLEQLETGVPGTSVNGPTYGLILDEKIAGMPIGPRAARGFSTSGDRIVFVSDNKLYIADQTGTAIRPLLENLGPWERVYSPRWSPDGRLIAYVLTKGLPADSGEQMVAAVFVVGLEGEEPRQIGHDAKKWIADPFWTPDSRHLSYWNGDGLCTLTLDGNEVRLIPAKDLTDVGRYDFSYSPNGRWIMSNRKKENGRSDDRDLCIFPATGGPMRRLTSLPGFNAQATWAPDGRTIYFISQNDDWNIWKLPMDPEAGLAKGKPQQVTFLRDTIVRGPKILGDGSRIAFSMYKGNTSIQVADVSSPHKARSLVRSGRYSPELSPDGQTIYYVNDTPGEQGIFAVPRQGGTPRRLTQDLPAQRSHSRLPRFDLSPDGQTLAYVTQSGE
ncbi:tetratricopeptide repeat protein, partial [Planctomycetota bacterium]